MAIFHGWRDHERDQGGDLGCDCPSWRCGHAICRQCEPACPDCEREADAAAAETDAIVEATHERAWKLQQQQEG